MIWAASFFTFLLASSYGGSSIHYKLPTMLKRIASLKSNQGSLKLKSNHANKNGGGQSFDHLVLVLPGQELLGESQPALTPTLRQGNNRCTTINKVTTR